MVLEYRLFHGRICIVIGMAPKDGTTGEEELLNKPMNRGIYHFPTEDSFLNLREGAIAPANRWEMNIGWRKTKCLLPYTCTDCSLKTEDMRLVAEKSLQP
ncbi:hypothetical protein [Bacillus cereus]|uniref:hypothetical protein n=1 Tax=Bacillus cereus TaxID=1396 RepID=UPI001D0D1912|nr:hypothetical protein [Bacillus cereus]